MELTDPGLTPADRDRINLSLKLHLSDARSMRVAMFEAIKKFGHTHGLDVAALSIALERLPEHVDDPLCSHGPIPAAWDVLIAAEDFGGNFVMPAFNLTRAQID
jgi:hypothetical protein